MYRFLAIAVPVVHLGFILWVIFGALVTRGRPILSALHVASLFYSIVIEVAILPCPLTRWEQWAQRLAGMTPYPGDFLPHFPQTIIYPNVPLTLLVPAAVAVCLLNLAIHARRFLHSRPR